MTAAPGGPSPAKGIPFLALAVLGAGALLILVGILFWRGGAPPGSEPPSGPSPVATEAVTAPGAAARAPTEPPAVVPTVVELAPALAPASPAPAPPAPALPSAAPATPPKEAPIPPRPTPTPPIVETYACRESAVFDVSPEETLVTVDGETIGTADDWDDAGGGKKYRFRSAGPHYVRLSLARYRTTWIRIDVRPGAEHKTANVDLELKKAREKDRGEDEE